jgi:mono/diheme cytochrome c family protein
MSRKRLVPSLFWISLVGFLTLIVLNGSAVPADSLAQAAQTSAPAAAPAKTSERALLDRYCVTCHNSKLRTGNLALDDPDLTKLGDHPEIWERVIYKIQGGMMPPVGRPRPEQAEFDSLLTFLKGGLDSASALNPNPGRTQAFHRLNRAEYKNAIRDLFALDVDVAALLPPDDTHANGFDNMADVLTVSPSLLDRYMSSASKISRLAVGIAPAGPAVVTYGVNGLLDQRERLQEELPFGSRGGLGVRHYFPVDGEYTLKITLQTNYVDYIRGLGEPHELDIRVDGGLVRRFTIGGGALGGFGNFPAPPSYGGDVNGDDAWEKYVLHADEGLEVRFDAKAGDRLVGVSFRQKRVELEGPRPEREREVGSPFAYDERTDGYPAIDHITIGGPYKSSGPGDTPSRRRVFVCRPARSADEEACAKRIVSTVARRAYRRPATDEDVETLDSFYKEGRAAGFDAGIQVALQRVLSDPEFLFRIERDPANLPPGTNYRLTDLELASRLSFFLWSSIPDDELLDLAARGRLKDPAVLVQQVRRLLSDSRSKALAQNFIGEWLELRNVQNITPDENVFPEFDENLRQAFQRETELFIDSQLHEDQSVMALLTANYTFVNEQLAKHYGIPNVSGPRFRRVTLADDQRAGVLGQGSVLAVTSYPNRTSPVLRGKFLLQNILGTPPSPPPPTVPGLPERGEGGKPAAVRERLERHRKDPFCAGCHAPMDPLGFALENFDGIGAWRTEDTATPIDPTGTLPSGRQFTGPTGLRSLLTSRRSQFVETVTERLLAFALGRAVEPYDFPVVRKIARDTNALDNRWSSIIIGIAQSTPFQMRRSLADGH